MTQPAKAKRKPGRPLMGAVKMRRYYVTLDVATVDKLRERGGGNLSDGIRRAAVVAPFYSVTRVSEPQPADD